MANKRAALGLDLSGLAAIRGVARKRAITLKAVKAASRIVQPAAKAGAPKESGAMAQSIGTKAVKGTRSKTGALAVIGARVKVRKLVKRGRGGKRVLAVPAKYLHLVTGGTKPHGSHPGSRPNPFMLSAFSATKGRALDAARSTLAAEIQKVIAREAARLAAKG